MKTSFGKKEELLWGCRRMSLAERNEKGQLRDRDIPKEVALSVEAAASEGNFMKQGFQRTQPSATFQGNPAETWALDPGSNISFSDKYFKNYSIKRIMPSRPDLKSNSRQIPAYFLTHSKYTPK